MERKKLKIVHVCPFFETVPPEKYGGIERVAFDIIDYMVRQGHEVSLVSAGHNKRLPKEVKRIQVYKEPVRQTIVKNNLLPRTAGSFESIGLAKAVWQLSKNKYDIIHSHVGWHLFPYKLFLHGQIVVTLHGPMDKKSTSNQYFYSLYKNENYVSISDNQRKPANINFIKTIYNPVEVSSFTFKKKPGDYLVWLGRISPEKGPVQAIKAAQAAGEKLIMALKVDPYDREFWEKEVKPLIDGKQIKYVGEISHKQKNKLLGGAKAMLSLIQWEEPFGLFFIESLACGTPVIATPRGSVPEILEDGKTGFFVRNIQEAVQAIRQIDQIGREYCRTYAEKHFAVDVIGKKYEKVYYQLLNK